MSRPVISRPRDDADDERLTDHSAAVGDRLPTLCRFGNAESPSPAEQARCVGVLHDLGKATTYFQRHVRDEYVEDTTLTYHARLGAFAAAHALVEMGASEADGLVGFLAILRHHGRLPSAAEKTVEDVLAERSETSGASWALKQIEDVDDNDRNRSVADTLLRTASNGAASWESFEQAITDGSLFDTLLSLTGDQGPLPTLTAPAPDKVPSGTYDCTLRLWSALTLADKTSAAGIAGSKLRPTALPLDSLETHLDTLRTDAGLQSPPALDGTETSVPLDVTERAELNQLRESVRRLVRANAESFAEGPEHVATLTLPTGLGKTFTGLTAAYTIRDALDHQELGEETAPRVIYALPYTSIIEQTRSLFESESIFAADSRGSAFTVHHYLSETVTYPTVDSTESGDGDQATDDTAFADAALLGEGWRSGTVLTTFVQLFDSLTGPTNGGGLKLSALTDSVLILDEPQTLPKRWWEAIRRLTELLVEQYNVRIISMTATQPSLFTHASSLQTRSLLASGETATSSLEATSFEAVSRVEYTVDESVRQYGTADTPFVEYETAGERLAEAALHGDPRESSVLAVCNTIASTKAITDATQSAATEAGVALDRIGTQYRKTLFELTGQPDVSPDGLISDTRPTPKAVAEATLRRLGLVPTNTDDERPLAEQTWSSVDDETNRLLLGTFSSRLRPRDRSALVIITNVLARADVPFVLVSTQAVEAGVDISFSAVFRDLAPMDSIVQAAGRCNRSFEWGHSNGQVTVWALAPVEGTADPPATYVYQPREQLAEVASILTTCCATHGDSTLPEALVTQEAVPRYFEWVEDADLSDPELVEGIETCDGQALAREHLIDDDYEKRDVIVAETPVEDALVEAASEAFRVGDLPTGFDLLADLADLRISVPVEDIETIQTRVHRLDHREFADEEGVAVVVCTATGEGQPYDLADGGFIVDEDDGLAGRFTF